MMNLAKKISILLAFSMPVSALAQSLSMENNPFFPPSVRNANKVEDAVKEEAPAPVCDASTADVQALTAMLQNEANGAGDQKQELKPELDIPDELLGDNITRAQLEQSKYLGEVNGYRVYFNEQRQTYFNIEIGQARSLENGE